MFSTARLGQLSARAINECTYGKTAAMAVLVPTAVILDYIQEARLAVSKRGYYVCACRVEQYPISTLLYVRAHLKRP